MAIACSLSSLIITTTDNAVKTSIIKQSLSIGLLLSSSSNMYRIFSWVSIYSDQFLRKYAPIFSKIVSVLILLLPLQNSLESIFETGELGTVEGDENISTTTGTLNQYSNFVDDRVVRTTVDDKKRLKRNGFNKFRYCSEEYLNTMREYITDVEIKDKITKNNNKKTTIKVVNKKTKKNKKL